MKKEFTEEKDLMAKYRAEFTKEILDYIEKCMKEKRPESMLIAVLHKVQDHYGYLSKEKLDAVAHIMQIPAAKVSGVASFYHYFQLKPTGEIIISICMGTACYVKGAEKVAEKFKEELGIEFAETTKDNRFTLMETRCLGMCAMAPVIKIGDDIHAKVTVDQVRGLIERYSKK